MEEVKDILAIAAFVLVSALIVFIVNRAIKMASKHLEVHSELYAVPQYLSWVLVIFWATTFGALGYREAIQGYTLGEEVSTNTQLYVTYFGLMATAMGLWGSGAKKWMKFVQAGVSILFYLAFIYLMSRNTLRVMIGL